MCICHEYALVFFFLFLFVLFLFVMLLNFSMNKVDYYYKSDISAEICAIRVLLASSVQQLPLTCDCSVLSVCSTVARPVW